MSIRVLFTGGTLSERDRVALLKRGIELDIIRADPSERELVARLQDKDAYILGGVERVTDTVLDEARSLRVLAFLGVGYESFIDADAATRNGIAVTNAPGANSQAVAEFAMGLMLNAVRQITYLSGQVKRGAWQERRTWNLREKTLGIVGLGAIGTKVAKMARSGFEMNVVYFSRSRKPDVEKQLGIHFSPLNSLLSEADVLSIHAPYRLGEPPLLGAKELARIKPGAVLINTSPAHLIDSSALREALVAGTIASVAQDGYYLEPAPSPQSDTFGLMDLPDDRLIITPHTANLTNESMEAMLEINIASIDNILNGREDCFVVNPEYKHYLGRRAN